MSIGIDSSSRGRAAGCRRWAATALAFGAAAEAVQQPESEVALFVLFGLLQGVWSLASP